MKSKSKATPKKFDRYDYYRRAVQSPDVDVLFLRDTYREITKREDEDSSRSLS